MTLLDPILDARTRRACELIAADPGLPWLTAVVAPGGYGKTVVLGELTAAYRRAGQLVVHTAEGVADLAGREPAALVVDDAHLLSDVQLKAVLALAETGQVSIAVAYRPWPRPSGLAELAAVLSRGAPPLVPAAFDHDQVCSLLRNQLGSVPPAALVEFVHVQTGGVPRFVGRLAGALAGGEPVLPDAAVLPFHHDLHQLDDDVVRYLLAVEAGAGLHLELLTGLFDRDHDAVAEVMAAARATGLLGHDGALLPISRRAVGALVPTERRVAVRRRLAELQLAAGGPVLALACGLLGTGVAGPGVAAVFDAGAREAAAQRPDLAARLFEVAATAGSPFPAIGAPWAHAAARAGDLDTALRLADRLIATETADRAAAACVAAAALAYRGQLARSAELYRWAGTGAAPAFAEVASIGTGEPPQPGPCTPPASSFATAGSGDPAGPPGAPACAATPPAGSGDPAGPPGAPACAATSPAGSGDPAGLHGAAMRGPGAAGAGAGPVGPPTMLAGAAALLAQGVRQSVAGPGAEALGTLVRAAVLLEPTGGAELLPDSPAALAAIVALHGGELAVADAILRRAAAFGVGGPLLAIRHRLLLAWIAMLRGDPGASSGPGPSGSPGASPGPRLSGSPGASSSGSPGASSGPGGIPGPGPSGTWASQDPSGEPRDAQVPAGVRSLEPRDELFAAALELGAARRASDLGRLAAAWPRACEAIVGHPVDLFSLLPLGELAVAAARLGEQPRLAPRLAEARALLAALGNPPLWSAHWYWSGVHAAIVAGQAALAEEHAAALAATAEHGHHASVLSAAAQCWLAVTAGRVDAGRVEAAARGLHSAGLCWDGARLAGQAAIRTTDRRAMVQLLDCARVLQGRSSRQPVAPAAATPEAPEPAPDTPAASPLSARELEVAGLLLSGLTYRDIGARLFISAKTVEHHVARMRRRLGCTSRADLLDQLRQLTARV